MSSSVELEQIPCAAALIDPQGAVHAANQRYRDLAGGTAGETLGEWLADAVARTAELAADLAAGQLCAETSATTVDGRLIRMRARYRSAAETSRLLIVLDQAPRKPARLPPGLISRLSHDICSPLNAILGFTRLLQEDTQLPADAQDFIKTIADSADTLQYKVEDFAQFMRMAVEDEAPGRDEIRLSELIADALRSTGDDGAPGIALTDSSACDRPIIADEGRIRLLLARMTRCLRPEAGEPGQFRCAIVSAATGDLEARLALSPCGPAEADANLHRRDSGQRHPSAVDLLMCKQLAAFLGGQAQVQAEPGNTARLTVVIPVEGTAEEVQPQLEPRSAQEATVDDELSSELAAAARSGDLDALRALLPRVAQCDAGLAERLAGLIDNFDYAGIDRWLAINGE